MLLGCTPLHWAALKGNLEVCTVLVHAGTKQELMVKDNAGFTPVQIASDKGHQRVALFLVRNSGLILPSRLLITKSNQDFKIRYSIRMFFTSVVCGCILGKEILVYQVVFLQRLHKVKLNGSHFSIWDFIFSFLC